MRWIVLSAYLLGSAQPLEVAASPPPGSDSARSLSRQDAGVFATQLRELSSLVCRLYIKPVARERLIRAGLRGLYEAAGQAMPLLVPGLLHQALKDERELHRYLTAIRLSLGDPETLRGQKAIRASLKALTQALDPFCAVVSDSELLAEENDGESQSFGLEPEETKGAGQRRIKTVRLGGPAQKAGLRPGDLVLSVNGQSFDGSSFPQAKELRLSVRRGDEAAAREITLKPALFSSETVLGVVRQPDNTWDYFLDSERRIAHIRLARLGRGTPEELAQVLDALGAAGMHGLLLDLRWCPGGYLTSSCRAAGLFLGNYGLPFLLFPTPANWAMLQADFMLDRHSSNAAVVYRDGSSVPGDAQGTGGYIQFPMIVLVDEETSGGAELIAAVLQDNHRALIAGRRTRGKASVQILIPLSSRGNAPQRLAVPLPDLSLKLTTGYMVRPSGRSLHRFAQSRLRDDWGVRPDPGFEIRLSPELSKHLKESWQLQDLRPGTSAEALPLDDPLADPQRQAAFQRLREMLRQQDQSHIRNP